MKNVILFGPMGAGKTTVANIISNIHGHRIVSLGYKIHDECRLHGQETREQMQQYGQMMRQIFGENVWNDYLYTKTIPGLDYAGWQCVIDDGRQLNEFDYWTDKGFLTVGVIAGLDAMRDRIFLRTGNIPTFEQMTHDTEMQARECVAKCRIKIINTGTKEYLHEVVKGCWGGAE